MGKTIRKNKSYYKYKAPIYHKEYVESSKSKSQPINRHKNYDSYWGEKFNVTHHALERYVERFLDLDICVAELTHKEKVKLTEELIQMLPSNFKEVNVPMKYVLSNGCKAVVNEHGIVVTIMKNKGD